MNSQLMDQDDPLASFRNRFIIDEHDLIYLDGNSLGRMPKATARLLRELAEHGWGEQLVRGWKDWFGLPERLGSKIAKIIGAQPEEVIVSDSTTVNLYKLVSAALALQPSKSVVLTDDLNFPSDLYALQSAVGCRELRLIRSPDGISLPPKSIADAISEDVALLTLSHVSFKSAYLHDMSAVTELAHSKGVAVLWDLSHSVGAVPIDLENSQADFAIGCTYKYLNGGPGAPAFLYVRRDLQEKLASPIWGWFGHKNPFAFDLQYAPASGLRKFLVGTPPVLSMAAIEPGLDLVLEAGLDAIRAKSIKQTDFLLYLWELHLKPVGVAVKSPLTSDRRGSHLSFGHPEALRIDKALIGKLNVITDFRAPDNLRFGISPLYTSYAEIETGVKTLERVLKERLYESFDANAPAVT